MLLMLLTMLLLLSLLRSLFSFCCCCCCCRCCKFLLEFLCCFEAFCKDDVVVGVTRFCCSCLNYRYDNFYLICFVELTFSFNKNANKQTRIQRTKNIFATHTFFVDYVIIISMFVCVFSVSCLFCFNHFTFTCCNNNNNKLQHHILYLLNMTDTT